MLQPKIAKADGIKREDHGQLKLANGSQSNNPSKKRKRGQDGELSGPRKKIKREESGTKSTKALAVQKSETESETPKPGKVIGALIGKKRRLKKARRGGG